MLPYPLTNETAFSFCSRLARLNHGKGFLRANIYGSSQAEPAKAVFGGFGHLDRFLASHDIKADTYSHTSMLPFFKPFTVPTLYTVIREHAIAHAQSVGHLMSRIFIRCISEEPRVCLTCVEADFQQRGFSYIRRQHQIICNVVCEVHHEILLSECPYCEAPLVADGIPQPTCVACGASPRNSSLTEFESDEQSAALKRIACAVTSIFAGDIVGNMSMSSFLKCPDKDTLPECTLNAQLGKNILDCYGSSYLSTQQMHPARKPHFGWPGIYAVGNGGGSNPIMELLLHGADRHSRGVHEYWGAVPGSYRRRGCHSHSAVDFRVLKTLFKYMTVMEACVDRGVEYSTLNSFVHAYPMLHEKLDQMRSRKLIKKHRESVLGFLDENPSATLMDLKAGLCPAYRYLMRNDMEWWRTATAETAKVGLRNRWSAYVPGSRKRRQASV